MIAATLDKARKAATFKSRVGTFSHTLHAYMQSCVCEHLQPCRELARSTPAGVCLHQHWHEVGAWGCSWMGAVRPGQGKHQIVRLPAIASLLSFKQIAVLGAKPATTAQRCARSHGAGVGKLWEHHVSWKNVIRWCHVCRVGLRRHTMQLQLHMSQWAYSISACNSVPTRL